MHKKKVLLLVNELLRGGGQRIVIDVAKRIDRTRFEPVIVHLKTHLVGTETLVEEAKSAGVRVIDLKGVSGTSLMEALRLFRLLREERPDIVHTFLPYAGVIGRTVARLAGVRGVFTTQCNLAVAYSRFWFFIDSITLRFAHVWIGVTEGIERANARTVAYYSDQLWKEGRRHFTVFAGVDLPTFDARMAVVDRDVKRRELGLTPTDVMVTMIARLIPWKGHEDLIASMAQLPAHFHVFIVGWGPLSELLRIQATSIGVESRLHLLGTRNDIAELLAATDVYAATHNQSPEGTVWMGANIAQMEACAARIPSMSTAIPYIENLIEDRVSGLLAAVNDPTDIARAVRALAEDRPTALRYAENARQRVEERYSVATMVRTYEALYERISR